MLQSYLRSAVRALLRQPVPAAINLVGLSIAVASAVVVYLFLQVYYTLDTHHARGDRIAIVEHVVERNGEAQVWGTVPAPLAQAAAADLPEVEAAVRMAWRGADVRTATGTFAERVAFADPAFFEVFSFPLASGSPAAVMTPGQATLSQDAAARYFGEEDPMGRTLLLTFDDGGAARAVTVGGVAAPFPNNASFRFSVLLPLADQPAPPQADDWAAFADATFLLLRPGADWTRVTAGLDRYTARQRAAAPDWPIAGWRLERLTEPAADAYLVHRRPAEAPFLAFALIMTGLAVLMMALACFNYVNIALGSAARRLREIGVRKVVGGTRAQLVGQFMAENVLLCGLALALGLLLAWAFFIPLFNNVMVLQIGLGLGDWRLWTFLAGLLLTVAVASGAYPALYVSAFRPAPILRGGVRLAERRWFTRALVTTQFAIVFVAVIMSTLLLMNGHYLLGQEWGYAADEAVTVRVADGAQFEAFRAEAERVAGVEQVAGARGHVGVSIARVEYQLPGEEAWYTAGRFAVGPGYFEVLGMPLRVGQGFAAEGARLESGIVVNGRLAKLQGWAEPIGQTLRLEDGRTRTVVGVVEDVLYDPIVRAQPAFFERAEAADYRYLVARVVPGRQAEVLEALEARWATRFPELAFDGFVQREAFAAQMESYTNLARAVGYLGALALLIACMGLFGLATQNAARRLKEVSVRKVLGASAPHLVLLVNRPFLVLLALAAGIATAVCAAGFAFVLSLDFANLMPMTPVPFGIAYAVVLATVALSVAGQSRRLVRADPAAVLRSA